jgi:uncharacterized protein (DUF111 family)
MKKGRPAHTLSVLTRAEAAGSVRAEIFAETSAIGLREVTVGKLALDRELATVEIDGQRVSVKLARHGGRVVSVQPEYDDIVAAAAALQRPVKDVLAEAVSVSAYLWQRG